MLEWWTKPLGVRSFLVFQRLRRLNQTFIVLAALISALDVGALSYDDLYSDDTDNANLNHVAKGLFCSSAMLAVTSALTAGMLLFQYEGLVEATRLEYVVAWLPLVLMDVGIFQFLIGITCWYYANNARWRGALMVMQLLWIIVLCVAMSTFMWFGMSRPGGLGKEDGQVKSVGGHKIDADAYNGPQRIGTWLGESARSSHAETRQCQQQDDEVAGIRERRRISIEPHVAEAAYAKAAGTGETLLMNGAPNQP